MTKNCDFNGCGEPVCYLEQNKASNPRFCISHREEFADYVRSDDAQAMVRFWIQSHGGARQLAVEMIKARKREEL